MDAPEPGIGPYRILETLGRGGMGVVYRARHLETGQVVALKTVKGHDERMLQGIRREIHVLSRLRHPGVVRILETGTQDGAPWMAMELLEGATLQAFRAELVDAPTGRSTTIPSEAGEPPLRPEPEQGGGPPASDGAPTPRSPPATDLRTVLTLVRRLCSPLAFLHGEGIVHGDLKPANILVTAERLPILVDFGLMLQFSGEVSRETLEALGAGGGTMAYMAPERALGQAVDARADLYALGCILYELLTGRPPFAGPTNADILYGHVEGVPLPPSALTGGLPPELDMLALRLLEKRPRDRLGHAGRVADALGRLGGEDWPGVPPAPRAYLYRPGFFGREKLIVKLDRHLARLESGIGGAVLVGGESGAGKTRLAIEAARLAKRRRLRVLSGECLPPGGGGDALDAPSAGPLHALRRPLQSIADRCRERGPAETERLLGPRGRLLARYEPALAGIAGLRQHSEPRELPADAARLRLYTALEETLAALADPRGADGAPILLILDDLQWADELTLGLIEHLTRGGRIARMRLLLLGTFRTEEAGAELQRLAQSPLVENQQLEALEESAIDAIVADMLALAHPPWWLGAYLSHMTDGNPFFVAEVLRAAVDEGMLHRDGSGLWRVLGGDWEQAIESGAERLRLPRSVRELVERRLHDLPAEALALAEVLAVLGREAPLPLLALAAGAPRSQHPPLLGAVSELVRRQVLEEPEPGVLRFVHDQLREVAYLSIPEPRKKELHRAAAQAVELHSARTGDRDAQLPTLARHWEEAGEPERAQDEYLAAARKASARSADREAERLCRASLRLARGASTRSVWARHELAKNILEVQGRSAEAVLEHLRLLGEARQLQDAIAEGMALRGLGRVNWALGQGDEAVELLEQALAVTRKAGDLRGEGRTLGNLGVLRGERGALDEGRLMLEQALILSVEAADESAAAVTLDNLAGIHAEQGRAELAEPLFEQALAIHRSLGRRRLEGHTLGNLAILMRSQGRLVEARTLYEQALAIAREVGHRRLEGYVLGDLGALHALEGRPKEAESFFEQALVILRELGTPQYVARVLAARAALRRRAGGDLAEALKLAQEAAALSIQTGDSSTHASCLCEQGHVALARGSSGRPELEAVRQVVQRLGVGPSSELGQAFGRLERAVLGAEAGRELLQGELEEDVPPGLRQGLRRNQER